MIVSRLSISDWDGTLMMLRYPIHPTMHNLQYSSNIRHPKSAQSPIAQNFTLSRPRITRAWKRSSFQFAPPRAAADRPPPLLIRDGITSTPPVTVLGTNTVLSTTMNNGRFFHNNRTSEQWTIYYSNSEHNASFYNSSNGGCAVTSRVKETKLLHNCLQCGWNRKQARQTSSPCNLRRMY